VYFAPAVFFVAFVVTVLTLPPYITWLQRREIGQFLRDEGPRSHLSKAKTPTAGGLCFIAAIIFTFLLMGAYNGFSRESALVLILAILCGAIGLADDLAKLRRRSNQGLSALLRLCLEGTLGVVFGFVSISVLAYPFASRLLVSVPITSFFGINLSDWAKMVGFASVPVSNCSSLIGISFPPLLIILLAAFLVAASTNAVNLHDGMDGLAAGTSILVLLSITVMLSATAQSDLASLALLGAGGMTGFLIFNRHPARIFMGDTGSLFVGGLLAGLVLASGLVLWFIPLSAIYIAEAMSVILQVLYFKITKPYEPATPMGPLNLWWLKLTKRLPGEGKRLFRMAPLHHHFEAVLIDKGFGPDQVEWMVVGGFWFVQSILCAVTLLAFAQF
jgi:phospho-N-acetylmuramoyl-pentapeptide-transferase